MNIIGKFLALGTKIHCAHCGEYLGRVGRKKKILAVQSERDGRIYCNRACHIAHTWQEQHSFTPEAKP